MPLDGITAHFLAHELHARLQDARVDRIYQYDATDFIFHLRIERETVRLAVSIHAAAPRIHLTNRPSEQAAHPPMFCMLLRKHLLGARLLSVRCENWERVFVLSFRHRDELGDETTKNIIVEIMGRHSNLILTSSAGTIIDAAHHIDSRISRAREILPAHPYELPPAQGKKSPEEVLAGLRADPSAFFLALSKAKNVELGLLGVLRGFSPPLCREICHLADIDGRMQPDRLEQADRERLQVQTRLILERLLNDPPQPALYRLPNAADDEWSDFHILRLTASGARIPCLSISAALDTFFTQRLEKNRREQRRRSLAQAVMARIRRMERKADAQRADIRSCDGYDDLRRDGELILHNLYALKNGIPGFEAVDYAGDGSKVWVKLDATQSLTQNAQRLFKAYRRLKTRLQSSTRLLNETMERLRYLASLATAIDNALDPDDLDAVAYELEQLLEAEKRPENKTRDEKNRRRGHTAGKPSASKGTPYKRARASVLKQTGPRKYRSAEGFTILAGRNNIQNDHLTFRLADRADTWLHVRNQPGTHVIIRAERRDVPERTLVLAAQIAAWFSRSHSRAEMDPLMNRPPAVDVDYCPVSHVKKIPGAGPGMVRYENHQTLRVIPHDPAALGVQLESDP